MGNSGLNHWIKSLIKRWRTKENKVKNLVMSLFVLKIPEAPNYSQLEFLPKVDIRHCKIWLLATFLTSSPTTHCSHGSALYPQSLGTDFENTRWPFPRTVATSSKLSVSKNCSIQFICVPDTFLYLFIVVNKQTNPLHKVYFLSKFSRTQYHIVNYKHNVERHISRTFSSCMTGFL